MVIIFTSILQSVIYRISVSINRHGVNQFVISHVLFTEYYPIEQIQQTKEVPMKFTNAVGYIKMLVGDDTMKGAIKYGKIFSIRQKPHLIMASNRSKEDILCSQLKLSSNLQSPLNSLRKFRQAHYTTPFLILPHSMIQIL